MSSMPNTSLKARDGADALETVRWAVAEEAPLELVGRGSKRALGRPSQAACTLDLSALTGVGAYEPEELVLSAQPATPLAEIDALLAENRQQLAFEPPDFGPLLGSTAGEQSLGGVLACNLAGPRRFKAGAARDHFLGCAALSGRGEEFKAGGRVVKNVTGYDMPKLFAGSYGTLVALTDVTVKVLPAPEQTRTLLLLGLEDTAGIAALTLALKSPYEVSGAAHVPAVTAIGLDISAGRSVTAIRLEGFGPSVSFRLGKLRDMLASHGELAELDHDVSLALWRSIRDVLPFAGQQDRLIWRLSVAPKDGPRVVAAIGRSLAVDAFYDWGGGLVWLALDPVEGAGAEVVRGAIAVTGGHATLIRAPDALRAVVPVFHPQPAPLAALTGRVKDSFDPKRIFNPGRMQAGV
jgi:glycolate oxidase FAD binding subunit